MNFLEVQEVLLLKDIIIPTENITNTTLSCINTCIYGAPPHIWGLDDVIKLIFVIILIILSALFAGLGLGIMGFDMNTLKIIADSGEEHERVYARRIMPVRSQGNYLLSTIVLGIASTQAAISILLSGLFNEIIGFLISTIFITLVGEILPQAIFPRYALFIGAHTTWIMYIFMVLSFPFTYPVGKCLDLILGADVGTIFTKDQLIKLFEKTASHKEGEIEDSQVKILEGALNFGKKNAKTVMTKIEHVFMLDINSLMDHETQTKIWKSGRSRIPIFDGDKNNVVSVIYTKDLVLIDPKDNISLRKIIPIYGKNFGKIPSNEKLSDIFKLFRQGKYHIAMVYEMDENKNNNCIGILTTEDIVEEIIVDEIYDETESLMRHSIMKKPQERLGINLFVVDETSKLSDSQKSALSSYLENKHAEFRCLNQDNIILLLDKAEIKTFEKDEFLYQRDKESNFFSLILNGKISIETSEDFIVEKGSWYSFGIRAFTTPKFVPDFNAKFLKRSRALLIHKNNFIQIIKDIHENHESFYFESTLKWIFEK